jgi:hypothetical protein
MAEDMTESINSDVARVIKERSGEVQAQIGCSEWIRDKIERTLVENAGGTFLWVSLVLEMLEDSAEASEEVLDRMMSTMPKGLDETYEKILREFSQQQGAEKAVTLLVSALRPLSLTGLNIALNIREMDRARSDVERRLRPLVRVIDSKVYLVHQTAEEFLIKRSNRFEFLSDSWKHGLDPVESNCLLARICTSYLSFDVFEQQLLVINAETDSEERTEIYARSHDLLDYAAKYWAIHFRRSKTRGEVTLLKPVLELCDTQTGRFITWFHIYWAIIAQTPAIPQNRTMLTIASHFGHAIVVRLLLEKGTDVNVEDSEEWTVHHWAVWAGNGLAWKGHEAVEPLLAAGADPSAKDKRGLTPLHWAAADG